MPTAGHRNDDDNVLDHLDKLDDDDDRRTDHHVHYDRADYDFEHHYDDGCPDDHGGLNDHHDRAGNDDHHDPRPDNDLIDLDYDPAAHPLRDRGRSALPGRDDTGDRDHLRGTP